MNAAKIGLKLANGGFYPVLTDGVSARKRLIVTTVKDRQKSVQIDLYRGEGPRVEEATYIGSLVVEDIPEAPRGEPNIRLELGLDATGLLSAYVEDPSSGERQSLKVSLESLSEEAKYEIPDFEFEEESTDTLPPDTRDFEEDSGGDSAGLLASAEEIRDAAPRRRALTLLLFGFLALVIALGFAFFIYRCSAAEAPAPLIVDEAPAAAPLPQAAASPPPQPQVIAAPIQPPPPATPAPPAAPPPAAAPQAAAAAETPPAKAPSGIRYRIRWGDTLWDLAYAHYRNPWLYPRIAAYNKIKNPDLIISGTWVTIPPR